MKLRGKISRTRAYRDVNGTAQYRRTYCTDQSGATDSAAPDAWPDEAFLQYVLAWRFNENKNRGDSICCSMRT
jgi:hypothetical protein